MNRKSLFAVAALAASLYSAVAFADQPQAAAAAPQAEQGQATPPASADAKPQPGPAASAQTPQKPQDVKKPAVVPPMMAAVKELKAKQEVLKKLVEDFKANPTEDGKAKIATQVGASLDDVVKIREMRIESEKASVEKLKKDRDAFIYKTVERLLATKQTAKADAGKEKPASETAKPVQAAKQDAESSAAAGK